MVALLWIAHALASVVTDVPRGEHRVALVLCPTEDPCSTEIFRVEGKVPMPMLMVEVVLELDAAEWEGGETLEALFGAAMERARAAWEAKRWGAADIALDDAEEALKRWSGTATNQQLFDLHYLRGAVRVARGEDATTDFRQAAAVAWNREVALPLQDAVAKAYYDAMPGLVRGGTGKLRLTEAPRGASWFLDGVELGHAAAEVRVFPGMHRVTARQDRMIRTWKRDVRVDVRQVRDVTMQFSPADDAVWVQAQLRAAFAGAPLPAEVMTLLSAWCERKDVHQLRLVMVGDVVRTLEYDPKLKRVTRP